MGYYARKGLVMFSINSLPAHPVLETAFHEWENNMNEITESALKDAVKNVRAEEVKLVCSSLFGEDKTALTFFIDVHTVVVPSFDGKTLSEKSHEITFSEYVSYVAKNRGLDGLKTIGVNSAWKTMLKNARAILAISLSNSLMDTPADDIPDSLLSALSLSQSAKSAFYGGENPRFSNTDKKKIISYAVSAITDVTMNVRSNDMVFVENALSAYRKSVGGLVTVTDTTFIDIIGRVAYTCHNLFSYSNDTHIKEKKEG